MSKTFKKYALVALEKGIHYPLDYGIPRENLSEIHRGICVEVPLRNSLRKGIVIDIKDTSTFSTVLPIARIISSDSLLPGDLFELATWMSQYYATPLAKVLKWVLPGDIRKENKEKTQQVVYRAKSLEELKNLCIDLREKSPKQSQALEVILKVEKEILLSELIEQSSVSRSVITTLIKKGLLKSKEVLIHRSPLKDSEYFPTRPKALNSEQAQVFETISEKLKSNEFHSILIHGVTGSGKTEVYLQAIQQALDLNKTVLMLVPEIALTTQTIERFRSRFEGLIAVLHHRLSSGERIDEWKRIKNKQAPIVIGARSAIFSPIQDLGLIIVDEEHEASYKQTDDMPCYHARDLAVVRAKLNKAVVVLGSATPSLESYTNAINNKYTLAALNGRADTASLPYIHLVDMKREYEKKKGYTLFSDELLSQIEDRFQKGEQSLLFLNRRGYHTSQICKECGLLTLCPHCESSLTFHFSENKLMCHLCGYELSPPPKECSNCKKGQTLQFKGVGTQQVERALKAIFPHIRTLRLDADTTRHKGSYEKLYKAFRTQKADVLIGTQMIAKGLHFPAVTLAAILNADQILQIPDYRASEQAFQLMVQVAGRAGRGEIQGEVIIQTTIPQHPLMEFAKKQDYKGFYAQEKQIREEFHFSPVYKMIKYIFIGTDAGETEQVAHTIFHQLKRRTDAKYIFHPVVPSGKAKINNRYRFHFLVSGRSVTYLHKQLNQINLQQFIPKKIKFMIDVDPLSNFF